MGLDRPPDPFQQVPRPLDRVQHEPRQTVLSFEGGQPELVLKK